MRRAYLLLAVIALLTIGAASAHGYWAHDDPREVMEHDGYAGLEQLRHNPRMPIMPWAADHDSEERGFWCPMWH